MQGLMFFIIMIFTCGFFYGLGWFMGHQHKSKAKLSRTSIKKKPSQNSCLTCFYSKDAVVFCNCEGVCYSGEKWKPLEEMVDNVI